MVSLTNIKKTKIHITGAIIKGLITPNNIPTIIVIILPKITFLDYVSGLAGIPKNKNCVVLKELLAIYSNSVLNQSIHLKMIPLPYALRIIPSQIENDCSTIPLSYKNHYTSVNKFTYRVLK